jgi:hypothetical protein
MIRKFVGSGVVCASFVFLLSLGLSGCSDDAGGNEAGVMDQTPGGRGTVEADTPQDPQDYYKKRMQQAKQAPKQDVKKK